MGIGGARGEGWVVIDDEMKGVERGRAKGGLHRAQGIPQLIMFPDEEGSAEVLDQSSSNLS